jgi:uncharacterized protein (TIGR02145 family)
MKNKFFYTILFFLLFITGIIAQAPQSMKYQAVARSATGTIIENQSVSLRVSILKSTVGGEIVFSETHNAMTNQFGMINLDIGDGAIVSGEFEAIKWGEDEHFIRLEMDANGGSNYQMMGTTQLLSVPYALFSGNGVQFDDDMECNENTEGTIRYNSESKTIEVCDGTDWVELGEGSTQFACGMPLVDARDGKVYATVAIGSQCWMAENLNYGTYKESVFTNDDHADVTNNGVVEKYALDNDVNNFDTYGGLYDWNEMMLYTFNEGAQGICPDGWHVPTYDEWQELIAEVGGPLMAGKELKMGGSSGFNYPLGGSRLAKGGFSGTTVGGIWTSSPSASHPTLRASVFNFLNAGDNIQTTTDVMIVGKSCRCLKD